MHWFEGSLEKLMRLIFINLFIVLIAKLAFDLIAIHLLFLVLILIAFDLIYIAKIEIGRWLAFYNGGRLELAEVIKSDFEGFKFPNLNCEASNVAEYFSDIRNDENNCIEVRLEAARYVGWLNSGWFFADVDKTKRKQVYLALGDLIKGLK